MPQAHYEEVECKTALTRVRGMAFRWSINPYRGCTHGCHYCFARSTHFYYDLDADAEFSSIIFVKQNIAEVLRLELSSSGWRRQRVVIGTATDPYQPIEGKYRLTRAVLEACLAFRTPVSIITKSSLVIRDLDLLAELAARLGCTVNFSITTLDRELWKKLEPGTAPPTQRLRALQRLSAAGVHAGVLLAPIVPGLTATHANLEEVARAAAAHHACFLAANVLNLGVGVKEHFLEYLRKDFPWLLGTYRHLYSGRYAPEHYSEPIYDYVKILQRRYDLVRRKLSHAPEPEPEQLSFYLS
jgi:DNA repair photolyase